MSLRLKLLAAFAYVLVLVLIALEIPLALSLSSRVDNEVSRVAQHQLVRSWVNAQVRRLAPPFVAEGRDMGTAVFPHAFPPTKVVSASRAMRVGFS